MRIPAILLWSTACWAQARAKPVKTALVIEREVAAGRSFVASVQPARRTTAGSEVAGLVTRYLAREGEHFDAGAPLAQLRTRLLDVRLAGARAELELRAQELAELENGSLPEQKQAARARLAQAEAEVELRRWKRGNVLRLFRSGSVTEDELKEAEVALKSADARRREQQAELDLVLKGPRKERIAQARARHEAQKAVVDQIEVEKERHTIRAPFTGYVLAEHSQVGAWLAQGDAVAEIAELDQVDVVVPVLEDFISGIRLRMKVSVTVDALPGERFDGVVAAVVPQADARARTFPVKIRIRNRERGGTVLLKAGMFARVTLAIGRKERALLVPKDAVVLGGAQPLLYVVEGGVVRAVPVRLGIALDALIQVKGELGEGQRVVVRGNERLRPGDQVRESR